MSRIDEALKRTAQEMREPGAIAITHSPQDRASVLDSFVEEKRAPQAPEPPQTDLPLAIELHPSPGAPLVKPEAGLHKLVNTADAEPLIIEQFRRLAAVLHDSQQETGFKTLLVSSAVPGEGKTLTIVNLALTFSESFQQRVLLIDADLRRPTIHHVLGCPNKSGLADVLANRSQQLPLNHVSSNLSVLTAGNRTSIPLAHLTSERMRNMIQHAASTFDWVLIDTPPVGLLPDAQLVARMSEGVLFVIAAGSTPYALVNRAIQEIGADRIVGTVLNRVEPRALRASSYYNADYGYGRS